jgi:hypothetical protein
MRKKFVRMGLQVRFLETTLDVELVIQNPLGEEWDIVLSSKT